MIAQLSSRAMRSTAASHLVLKRQVYNATAHSGIIVTLNRETKGRKKMKNLKKMKKEKGNALVSLITGIVALAALYFVGMWILFIGVIAIGWATA